MIIRRFIYNGQDLIDPDPSMSPDEVRQLYACTIPELNNAIVHYPDSEDGNYMFENKASSPAVSGSSKSKSPDVVQKVEFKRSVGKNG